MRFAIGLLLLLVASSAVGVTFDMRVVYICKDDYYCWDNDDSVLGFIEKANLKFVTTGISFRPTIERIVDANYAGIAHGEGNSARVLELLELAQDTPEQVTLFLIHSQTPQGDACWAKPPQTTGSSQATYKLFCNTGQSGAAVAHELGHYFCLPHPFTFDDPATHPEPISHDGDGLWETWEDPGVFETEEVLADEPDDGPNREWCDAVDLPDAYGDINTGANPGYYPQRGCTTECVQSTSGGGTFSIPYAPKGENGMSYFSDCWGPWTHDGTRREFFVPQQTQRMLTCIADEPERQLLVDACASLGGDSDGDGQCNAEDQCPNKFGLVGHDQDEDNDGISDDCDLCTGHPGNGTDTDSDTVCDARDVDDDNDGCLDQYDKHPLQDTVIVGHKIGDRPQCTGPIYDWEGTLIPGVGAICNKFDSNDVDNDGIPDSDDYCLLHPGFGCVQAVSCPLPPPHWRLICATGGCNELEFVAVEVSNPGTILVRSRFQIVNGAIYARASSGMSLFETASTLAGAVPPNQIMNLASGKAKSEGRRLRFEIRRRDGSVAARIAEVDAASIRLGPLVPADAIVLTTNDSMTRVSVDVSWGNGIAPGTKVPDADRDGIHDASDNCTAVPNRDQFDGDGDGYGNRCDPDLDNDGRVTKADSARMAAAIGGIAQPAPVAELESGADLFAEGSPVLYNAAADLDGDGRVTADDQRQWSGTRLGPSGIR